MATTREQVKTDEAPRYSIPSARIVSVEHPCIVKNVDKAIDMLGGGKALAETLDHASQTTLPLKFTPEGQSVMSINNATPSNVLLKITVPRCVGKRKRGSTDPFEPVNAGGEADAQTLLRSISDNPNRVEIEPLGMIENSHIFRSLPDFVYSTSDSQFKSDLEAKVLGQRLDAIKTFRLPESSGLQNTEMFPTPVLSTNSLPQTYSYLEKQTFRSKPSTRVIVNDSRTAQDTDPTWPEVYRWDSTRLEHRPPIIQDTYAALKRLFEQRPIWTLEAVTSSCDPSIQFLNISKAIFHLAFEVTSGPWEGTFCLYGLDPRKSARYAKYQTLVPNKSRQNGSQTEPVPIQPEVPPQDPRILQTDDTIHSVYTYHPSPNTPIQLCDIKDPQVTSLVNLPRPSLRSQCEVIQDGWYHSGTLAKIQLLLRIKLNYNTSSTADMSTDSSALPNPSTGTEHILTLPDRWQPGNNTNDADGEAGTAARATNDTNGEAGTAAEPSPADFWKTEYETLLHAGEARRRARLLETQQELAQTALPPRSGIISNNEPSTPL